MTKKTLPKKQDEENVTLAEITVLNKRQEDDLNMSANTERMDSFLTIIKDRFGLSSDFSVVGFRDKGKTTILTVQNEEFIISVEAKNTERLPMPSYD